MSTCPSCGALLRTLDLPCPSCALVEDDGSDFRPLVHEFSKSFHTRWAFRPDSDAFVATLNHWLQQQAGLIDVAPYLHWSPAGTIRGVTLTCRSGPFNPGVVFQFHRLPLKVGFGRRQALGTALNDWADRYPDHEQTWRMVLDSVGVPTEVWIVSAAPRHLVPTALPPTEPTGFAGVHRFLGPMLLLVGGLCTGAAVDVPNYGLLGLSVPVAVVGGWATWSFPPWHRRSRNRAPARVARRVPERQPPSPGPSP